MVNIERVFNGLRLVDHAIFCRCIERRLDERGDTAETKPAADELSHRDLVRGIEDGRECAAGCEGPPRKRQCGWIRSPGDKERTTRS